MSYLDFDGNGHQVALYHDNGTLVGSWPANNIVEHQGNHLSFVPNGTHTVATPSAPRRHSGRDRQGRPDDSANGKYGTYGAIVMNPINGHSGIAVHSGRATVQDLAHRAGINHATEGCIRTTDAAMAVITRTMHDDPIREVRVRNNHAQH